MKKQPPSQPTGRRRPRQPIQVEFIHQAATQVCIAGGFNDWHPGATPMVPLGGGRWIKELVLAPGVYEYRLVVDGTWMPDPRAKERVANPFGGENSLLKVAPTATHAPVAAKPHKRPRHRASQN